MSHRLVSGSLGGGTSRRVLLYCFGRLHTASIDFLSYLILQDGVQGSMQKMQQ